MNLSIDLKNWTPRSKESQGSNFHDDEEDVPLDDDEPPRTRPPMRRKPIRRPPLRRHYDED
jgi:hypothetical protein